jgi:murein DD-endopeptidase MepM/ murein hydrolase activator NlpD
LRAGVPPIAAIPTTPETEALPLRHDSRGPSDRPAHELLRVAAATALAVPVVGLIIGESLARRLGPSRPAFLIVGFLAGTIAISGLSTEPIGARSPTVPTPVADREFLAIPIPAPTIRSGEPVARSLVRSSSEPLEVASAPKAPAIVRFRPRHGWAGVSRFVAVSVRFNRPMDHASTKEAFHVVVGNRPVTGTFRWAEGDTVLVLTPASALPYGAEVALSVDIGARAADGVALADARSVTFRVQRRPAPTVRPAPRVRPQPRSSGWRWPLLGPITQRFGESLTQYGFHYGIDIDGDTGDPVRAARRGRVVVAGSYDQCGGLEIHVDHGGGLVTWYRHLSRIDVAKGTLVAAGTVIGRVGDTGCSLGSHLHFAIRKGSTFVDPLDYLPPR